MIQSFYFHNGRKRPALPAKFCELPEDERSKWVLEGSPLVLQCELDSTAEVFWSKDGTQLLQGDADLQSDGPVKKLCIRSANRTHAGVYECATAGDSITFNVDVRGDSCLPCSVLFITTCKHILVYQPNLYPKYALELCELYVTRVLESSFEPWC